MRLTALIPYLFLVSCISIFSCSGKSEPGFYGGPFRIGITTQQPQATADKQWVFYITLEGELPPAGAFTQIVIRINDIEIKRYEGQFYAEKRFLEQVVMFKQEWFNSAEAETKTPEPDMLYPLDTTTPEVRTAHISVEILFMNAQNRKWERAAYATRAVPVNCNNCRLKIY